MKYCFLIACLLALPSTIFAQRKSLGATDTSARSIDLNEVVVKYIEPIKVRNNVRSQNVLMVLNPNQKEEDERMERTYFATKFFQPEKDSISLHSIDLKLKPFDSAMFEIKLIVLQISGDDTTINIVPITGKETTKKGYLKIPLFNHDIILKNGEFYIGYGFHLKNVREVYKYRMYSSNKGEGAILTFNSKGIEITSDSHFPYVFPFKLAYRKL